MDLNECSEIDEKTERKMTSIQKQYEKLSLKVPEAYFLVCDVTDLGFNEHLVIKMFDFDANKVKIRIAEKLDQWIQTDDFELIFTESLKNRSIRADDDSFEYMALKLGSQIPIFIQAKKHEE